MPPLDFTPPQKESDDEIISLDSFFAPDEGEGTDEGERKDGRRGLEDRLEEKVSKRGEREIDKFVEEKWGGPRRVAKGGESALERTGSGVAREAGEELGGAARGAVGAGGRAVGGAGVRAATGGAARTGVGVVARGAASLAAGAAEGAAAGSAVPGAGTAIGAVVMTALTLPKSLAGAFKGEYKKIEFAEFTIIAVACVFLDIFFIPFGFIIPLASPLKSLILALLMVWFLKFKGSVKPFGMLRILGKLIAIALPMLPLLTIIFIAEGALHNNEGRDSIIKTSKPTKEKEKNAGATTSSIQGRK